MSQDLSKGQDKKQDNLPHWLRQMADAEEAPDWLRQLARPGDEMPDTAAFPDAQPEEPVESVFVEQETPDRPGDQAAPAAQLEPADELDWLQTFADLDQDTGAGAGAEGLEELVGPPEKEAELPDWLTGFVSTEEEGPAASLPPDEGTEAAPAWFADVQEPAPEGAPGWFAEPGDRGEEQLPEPVTTSPAMPPEEGELPDWLAGISDQAAEVSEPETTLPAEEGELPDWLTGISDQAATEVPEPETTLPAKEGELPDWLTGISDQAAAEVPEPETTLPAEEGELPDWLAHIDETEITEPTAFAPKVQETETPAWLMATEEEKAEHLSTFVPAEETRESGPDWLAGVGDSKPADALDWLAGIDDTEAGQDSPDWLAEIDDHTQAEKAEPTSLEAAGEHAQEEIPDWMIETERAVSEAEETDWLATAGQETGEEGVPDWLAGVDLDRLEEEQAEAEQMAFAPSDQDDTAGWLISEEEPTEKDVPGWLAEVEEPEQEGVPGWLQELGGIDFEQEMTTTGEQVLAPEGEPALPDWLEEEDLGESETDADLFKEIMAAEPTADQDASPQVRPRRRAEDGVMPTGAATQPWIERLRAQASKPVKEGAPEETSGPLSGLRGLLEPEPVLADLPQSEFRPIPSMPESHQAEAKLFEETLALSTDQPVVIAQPLGQLVLASLGRWALYLLLIATIVVAAFLPDPLSTLISAPEMAETGAFYNAIKGLPQASTVLLVIDYDASLDGELTPATGAIVRHLLHNQVGIVAVSLNPQGSAIVQDLFEESTGSRSGEHFINLGYLPPHPASLVAFVNNPVGGTTLFGTQHDPAQTVLGQQVVGLNAFDLVVTVSGSQEHVRWWIEQIGSQYNIDIVSAVSSSIAPYIQPYYASDQVKGMLIGLAGTADYERRLAPQVVLDYAQDNLLLQGYGQLLLVVILILSGITFIARGRK